MNKILCATVTRVALVQWSGFWAVFYVYKKLWFFLKIWVNDTTFNRKWYFDIDNLINNNGTILVSCTIYMSIILKKRTHLEKCSGHGWEQLHRWPTCATITCYTSIIWYVLNINLSSTLCCLLHPIYLTSVYKNNCGLHFIKCIFI